tara:strand:+ start:4600 stop:5649 length:1050 start_codon:yes stop_codon:yes gene_type:complete
MSWPTPPDPVPASGGWPGILPIGSNFNVGFAGPLDNRMTVGSVNDLPSLDNPYAGMFASVWTGTNGDAANGLYYFEPQVNAQGIITTNPAVSDWVKVGGGGGAVTDVLIDQQNIPGLAFDPTTAQNGNVVFTLKPQATSSTGSGTYLGLQTLYVGINEAASQPVYKVGQPGAAMIINYDNNDYVWKQSNFFSLATTATPTWYTQYEDNTQTPTAKTVYGLNTRVTLDKNITFAIGDGTNGNKIIDGELCTLIVKHLDNHSFQLTAGNVNGSSVTHAINNVGTNPFTLTNTAGAIDVITGLWDEGDQTMYWTVGLNYGGGSPPVSAGLVELEGNLFLVELESGSGQVELE